MCWMKSYCILRVIHDGTSRIGLGAVSIHEVIFLFLGLAEFSQAHLGPMIYLALGGMALWELPRLTRLGFDERVR